MTPSLMSIHMDEITKATFSCMEIAEEEIARAKLDHPDKRDLLHQTFRLLCPSEGMGALDPAVYRDHAREIVARVAVGEDTRLGTRAEALVGFSVLSHRSPLTRVAGHAFWLIFDGIFPGKVERPAPVSEWEASQAVEMIDEMRSARKVRDRK
jgi:hypothetical protein